MGQDFLGAGWSFPAAIDEKGAIALSAYEENVRQSIVLILRTAPGERQMRSDFGCEIHTLVFGENNATTAGRASFFVEQALKRWEPRIEVLQVQGRPGGLEREEPDVPATVRAPLRPAFRRRSPVVGAASGPAPDPGGPNFLTVDVRYRVIATNNVFNLVYPFYLTEGVGA
jgi:phage baseplate assembly protein W